jgi:hypothetical protein
MQAYQSSPCPYCGITWNQPGAQACANCRNPLPQSGPAYAPPGYAPAQPGQPGAYPQAGYGQPADPSQVQPGQYQGQPQQGQYPGQAGQYPAGYPQGYQPQDPNAYPQQGYQGYPAGQQYPQSGYPGYPQAYPGQAYPSFTPTGAGPAPLNTITLMGQTIKLPFAIPASIWIPIAQRTQSIMPAAAIVIGVFVLEFMILPLVTATQVSAAAEAITAAIHHQPSVDAAITTFLKPQPTQNTSIDQDKAQLQKEQQQLESALATLQGDESSLSGLDQRLNILGLITLPSHASATAQRARVDRALNGLRDADQALTAGINQMKLLAPMLDATSDYLKMSAGIAQHNLAAAGAPYPDAQQKLQDAAQLDQAPGIAPIQQAEVKVFAQLVNDTEQMILAIQNKDTAGTRKYAAAVQADGKQLASYSDSALDTYNTKTFGALQKSYDSAMTGLTG